MGEAIDQELREFAAVHRRLANLACAARAPVSLVGANQRIATSAAPASRAD
jgi:hypothetical protein